MRMLASVALASAMFASSALAGDAANSLAPGKPAGVKAAQAQAVNPVVYLGLGAVAAAVVVASSHSSHHNGGTSSSTTTTGTSP